VTEEKDKKFRDPELAINRVYTRKGDSGKTRLVGGQKVAKYASRIEAYGTLDELNSFVGAARLSIQQDHPESDAFTGLAKTLFRVQHELFNLGAVLATLPEDVQEYMPRVTESDVAALEASIDTYNADLPELRSFVLPGGTRICVELHQCRTICRRAERHVVALAEEEDVDDVSLAYLNRLSDAFFVWSRWAAVSAGDHEVTWDPNVGAQSD
jgi:cob(I)alamin adenosyltransferase